MVEAEGDDLAPDVVGVPAFAKGVHQPRDLVPGPELGDAGRRLAAAQA